MSDHTHTTYVATCYRCDLSRDEEVAALAEDYWDSELAAFTANLPAHANESMRRQYVDDVRHNPTAIRQLYEWAEERDAE